MTDAEGATTTYAYDASGNRVAETDVFGHIAACAYDLAGRLVKETNPLGGETRYS